MLGDDKLKVKRFSSDLQPHDGLIDAADMMLAWAEKNDLGAVKVYAVHFEKCEPGWDVTVVYEGEEVKE